MNEYMAHAVDVAKRAAERGEVPIGAVIVHNGKIIARAHNRREKKQNALHHAEVIAINRACRKLKSWRLDDCEMYITMQPCLMCMGAILNARIPRVYIGAYSSRPDDLKLFHDNNLNHKTEYEIVDCPDCSSIVRDFFAGKR